MPAEATFDNAALTAKIMSLKRTDSPLTGKSLADFLNERTTVEYVVDDVLVRGYVYSLTGATGSGKTAVAVPLSLYVALGRDFGRHEVQAGPVVYVAGENPADVRMRFAVAVQEMQINPKSFRYEIVDRSFILAERAEELQRIIEDVGAVLVVVDTDQAVSLSGATEENDNSERMVHAKRLREITRAKTRPTVLDLSGRTRRRGASGLLLRPWRRWLAKAPPHRIGPDSFTVRSGQQQVVQRSEAPVAAISTAMTTPQ